MIVREPRERGTGIRAEVTAADLLIQGASDLGGGGMALGVRRFYSFFFF